MLFLRISVALVTTAGALAIGHILTPALGDHVLYIVALAAVSFCAWYYGLVPSSISALLATGVLKYWFLVPVRTFMFSDSKTSSASTDLPACQCFDNCNGRSTPPGQ